MLILVATKLEIEVIGHSEQDHIFLHFIEESEQILILSIRKLKFHGILHLKGTLCILSSLIYTFHLVVQISRDLYSLVIEGLGHSFVSSAQLGLCNAHSFFKCVGLFLQLLHLLESRVSFFVQ